jgi:hypothetical protein
MKYLIFLVMDHGDASLRDSKASNLVALQSKTTFTMSLKPLDSLKKGLAEFSKQIKDCKDELNAKLLGRRPLCQLMSGWITKQTQLTNVFWMSLR